MVRNSVELGPILFKIAMHLAKNEKLCRYLVRTDQNPLDDTIQRGDEKQNNIVPYDLLNDTILLVPEVNRENFTAASKVCLVLNNGIPNGDNTEFKTLSLSVIVYTPLRSWIINDLALRPFSIIGEIEKSLKGRRIESLGTIKYNGFNLVTVDDDISGYSMEFTLDVFN